MGGVQHSTLLLAEYLWLTGRYDIETLLPNSGPFADKLSQKSIPIIFYKPIAYKSTSKSFFNDQIRITNPIAWVWNWVVILLNIIRIKKNINSTTDLVITKGLLNHLASGLACKRLNIPVICHLQDLITNRYFGLMNILFNIFAKIIPNYIICDGQSIQESLWKNNKGKSIVILNGVKTNTLIRNNVSRLKIRDELNIPQPAYVIGHLGRITPWKGQELLLKAFIEYSKHKNDAYLILVGSPLFDNDKYQRHLINMVTENKLESRVSMPGYRTDLKKIFSAMDLFIYPSVEKDTSPLALLSALSAGLPIGVSNIPSLSEITNLCPAVDIFNPKSMEEIILLMKKYEDPKLRRKRGEINRKSGVNYFDISNHSLNMVQTIDKAYRNTL